MKYRIVSDSASDVLDLPGDIDHISVPLKILIDDEEFVDNRDLDIEMMIGKMEKSAANSSSCPNVYEWKEAFEGADTIFCITITSGLSGSYNSAVQAATEYMEEHPGVNVYVIDSLSTGAEMHVTVDQLKVLMDRGCVIIGQHADSTGAPSACEDALKAGTVVYSVGYNIDMLPYAPTAALTSSGNIWEVYYEYAIKTVLNGGKVATNWAGGYAQGAVEITGLGASCAAGTKEAVEKAIADIKVGKLHVFDTSKFTVGGKKVTYAYASDTNADWTNDANNVVADGYYHESYVQSAPSFSLRIDGITELN